MQQFATRLHPGPATFATGKTKYVTIWFTNIITSITSITNIANAMSATGTGTDTTTITTKKRKAA